MFINKKLVILIIAALTACSSTNSREEKILKYSEDKTKSEAYEIYLVNPENYTTAGAEYHRQYYPYLIGIARLVAEEKKISLVERSIGFYYDKREDNKDKLYLGIDINVQTEPGLNNSNYETVALGQLKKYLNDLLYILQSCKTIFQEQEIVGSVIGIRWERDKTAENVSIWISKDDVIRYEQKELTFDEIIQRNFVTNTEGKIIRLLR